jgi:hypothetical protein
MGYGGGGAGVAAEYGSSGQGYAGRGGPPGGSDRAYRGQHGAGVAAQHSTPYNRECLLPHLSLRHVLKLLCCAEWFHQSDTDNRNLGSANSIQCVGKAMANC